jgi:predicted protein tyrosine phosphatase
MKLLFICNQNQHRSPTAEEIFKDEYETSSAGLYNENPVTEEQLDKADLIIVMEEAQREELAKRFPTIFLKKRIINIDIPDIYAKNQPELIHLLKSRMRTVIEPLQ